MIFSALSALFGLLHLCQISPYFLHHPGLKPRCFLYLSISWSLFNDVTMSSKMSLGFTLSSPFSSCHTCDCPFHALTFPPSDSFLLTIRTIFLKHLFSSNQSLHSSRSLNWITTDCSLKAKLLWQTFKGTHNLFLLISSAIYIYLPFSPNQWFSTRGNFAPQGTCGNVWRQFWLSWLWWVQGSTTST